MNRTFPLILAIALCACGVVDLAASDAPDFSFEVRPILSKHCFSCHGPDEEGRKAHLRLDSYEGAVELRKGNRAINPDDLADSDFIHRIESDDPDEIMPPPETKRTMTPGEIDILRRWVKSGAEYQDHWAFVSPVKRDLPKVSRKYSQWKKNPIDAFVLEGVLDAGLKPMPEAEKSRLIRRVTFDLTGLPPEPAEVEVFLKDKSKDAFEKVVDRLLASERYGERMALAWMDASRYGDSSVMHADGPRTMWPWRDWVIKAYNSNKPFNEFTVEQLAGDLLPEPSIDQQIASGFNRNHATSDEGGAFPEELRVEYIVDRVKTTANVWLGLSMECAQCHDHKYDPISMAEYYKFFAYFNNNADPGMQTRRGNQKPLVNLENKVRDTSLAENKTLQDDLREKVEKRRSSIGPDAKNWIQKRAAEISVDSTLKAQPAGLRHHIPFHDIRENKGTELFSEAVAKIHGTARAGNRSGNAALNVRGKEALDYKDMADFIDSDAPFTLAIWVKSPANRTAAIISRVKKDEENNDYRGFDIWQESQDIGFHLVRNYPESAIRVMVRKGVKANKWQHIAVSYDGSSKAAGVKFYINGEVQKLDVESDTLSGSIKTDSPFRIAGRFPTMNFQGEVDDIRIYDRALSVEEVAAVQSDADSLLGVFAIAHDQRSKAQTALLEAHYLEEQDETYKTLTSELDVAQKAEAAINKKHPVVSSMIMADLPQDKMRATYMLDRGQYDSPRKDDVVTSAVPSFLPAPPEDAPATRLGLARWLVQENHPLTARVTVNRYWSILFGHGIVSSEMDFGNQGNAPSYPKLLDWLAVDFVESGWDIKRMIKTMVMSQTYRQSSVVRPETLAEDPRNEMLARGARFRLQGEFIRDNALAVSGLLNPLVGGASVKPYQPPGIWNEVSLNKNLRYKQDSGEKLYRRSMYTYWKRSAPAPNMMIFDAPTREKCQVKRPRTNTPLQALVTLNDVHFVEASRKLAERMINEGGDDFAGRLQFAFMHCLSREATPEEIKVCRDVFDQQLSSFTEKPEEAAKYLKSGESKRDESIDTVQHAAYTVIANMILNLDEVLMRG